MTSKTFISGTTIDSAWLNDVNDSVYAAELAPSGSFREAIEASSGASLVGYLPAGTGAVATTVQNKLREGVSVWDFFFAVEADSTEMIQRALDHWVLTEGDLTIPPGNYTVSAELVANFTATANKGKRISAYGAIITSSSTGNALTVNVTAALARNITIEGLSITASAATNALLFDGKGPGGTGSQEYLFGISLRDLVVNNSAGHGISVINNAFEVTAISCHLNCNAGLLGSCFRFENVLGGGAIVSSITLIDCSTRGGTYGVVSVGNVNDIRIFGGTYLSAYYNGISLENCFGGCIINAHVESNWVSAVGNVEGHGGVSLVASGNFTVIGLYALSSGGFQTNAINIYCGANGHVQIIGGYSSATNYAYINGAAATASVSIIGKQTYNTTGVVRVSMTVDGTQISNGIQFPATQVPSSNANTLDDYEEGTFTPTIVGVTTPGVGTYTVQIGRYTKIGREVFFDLEVAVSAHTGTGAMRVAGLPFTANSVAFAAVSAYPNNVTLTAGNVISPLLVAGQSYISVNQTPTGGGSATNVAIDTSCDLIISGRYSV